MKDEKEHSLTIENTKAELENDFKCKNDSKIIGFNFGKKLINVLHDLVFDKQLLLSCSEVKKEIYKVLKSPSNLIDLAYRESIEIENYPNAYKYCVDINRFCLEIAQNQTAPKISSDLDHSIQKITLELNNIFNYLLSNEVVDTRNQEIRDTHQFIDQLELNMKLKFFEDILNKSKISISKSIIGNYELFKSGFKNAIGDEKNDKFKNRIKTGL